jgi:hypothetical protein
MFCHRPFWHRPEKRSSELPQPGLARTRTRKIQLKKIELKKTGPKTRGWSKPFLSTFAVTVLMRKLGPFADLKRTGRSLRPRARYLQVRLRPRPAERPEPLREMRLRNRRPAG